MKDKKYVYLGVIEGVHLFEEVPHGPVKDLSSFSRYFNFLRLDSYEGFKKQVLSNVRFVRAGLIEELEIKE